MAQHLYRLLSVHEDEGDIYAALPVRKVVGQEVRQAIDDDFQCLARQATGAVWLDLRTVESFDGHFLSKLVILHKLVKLRSCRLAVSVNASLAEVLRVTRLDEVFAVVAWPPTE